MGRLKRCLHEILIDGLSGMALGLFSTLIIGTVIVALAELIKGPLGVYLTAVGNGAKLLTGAGIGVGVACRQKQGPLVAVSAAVAGMIGAFPSLAAMETIKPGVPGEPLGAFVAAAAAVKIGAAAAGKTKIDILATPLLSVLSGALAGFMAGPPIVWAMGWLGQLVNVNVERHPVLGGMAVSVLMGMILTLPVSSAAIGVSLQMSGLAAGAATVGCCCNMVGFAAASYRENGLGGIVAQGVGTSMLQMPNLVKNPRIWLPAILSSALLGPVASAALHMTSTPVGSGMGSAGFVGQIAAYGSMVENGMGGARAALLILLMHFILPGALTLLFSELMRKKGWIQKGDMALDLQG